METCALRILSGMHAGAVVHLLAEQAWSIGSGEAIDVFLLDENIQALHARLSWEPGEQVWHMQAVANDIRVFDYLLKPGAEVDLIAGSRFSLGDVACDMAIVKALTTTGDPVVVPADAQAESLARMRFLQKAHPWRYGVARARSFTQQRYVMPVLWAGAASAAVVAMLLGRPNLSTEYREDSTEEIQKNYPDVQYQLNPVTGFTTYTGYVKDRQQLGALRQLALKANYGKVVMNVLPMDVLATNVSAMLDAHYRDPQVSVTGPGDITVEIASVDTIKDLEGWNFPAVQAKVLHELPELKTFTMALSKPALDNVSVPLDRLGFSVVSSSADQPFVVNQRGDRLFPGARVKEGRLNDINLCQVTLVSSANAAVFNMFAQKEKGDVCK